MMRKNEPCKYAPSCFSCPLPDCQMPTNTPVEYTNRLEYENPASGYCARSRKALKKLKQRPSVRKNVTLQDGKDGV